MVLSGVFRHPLPPSCPSTWVLYLGLTRGLNPRLLSSIILYLNVNNLLSTPLPETDKA